MITVSGIPYSDIKDHPELLAEYAEECGIAALGPPNPQWEIYAKIEAAGMLQAFAVYAGDVMVGFASVLCNILPHYGFKAATVESLFVSAQYRKYGAGAELMRFIEQFAGLAECKLIFYSAPAGGQLEALLVRRHTRTNSVFCKAL